MMLQPPGPVLPARFWYGHLPTAGAGIIWNQEQSNVFALITCIDVYYNGGGGSTLIEFSINNELPFWGSAPNAGTVHTEQYRGLVVLQGLDQLRYAGDQALWSINVSGFVCNNPNY